MTSSESFENLKTDLARMRTHVDRLKAQADELDQPLQENELTLLDEIDRSYDRALASLKRVGSEAVHDLHELPEDLRTTWRQLREAFHKLKQMRDEP